MMKYRVKSKIWIEVNDKVLLGEGRVNLLMAIKEIGSLSKAAKAIGMSYKKAWKLVDMMNERADQPLVKLSVGGKGGGGAILTDYGRSMVKVFEGLKKRCWNFLDAQAELTNL